MDDAAEGAEETARKGASEFVLKKKVKLSLPMP
jgi:hypothetical protein